MLLVICPTCKTENRVPAVLIGSRARCTQCQMLMLVPANAPQAEAPRLEDNRPSAPTPEPAPPRPGGTPLAPRPVQAVAAVMARPAPAPRPAAPMRHRVAGDFQPFYFWVRVIHDPDLQVHGELVATLSPEGLRLHCDDGTRREYFVPLDSPARHPKGSFLHVPLGRREIRLVIEDPNYSCKRLARDVADFLRGRVDRLDSREYAAPRPAVWPIVFYVAPLLVPLVGAALWLGGTFGVVVWSILGLLLTLLSLVFAVADRWGIVRRILWPGVLTFLGFIAMGGLYAVGYFVFPFFDPSPRWEKYTAPDGKWAIQMPRKPAVGRAPAPGQPNVQFDKYEARLPFRGGEFVVLVGSLEGQPHVPVESRFEGAKQGALNGDRRIKFLKEKNVTLHGRYPGREFWFEHPTEGKACFRVYIVGNDFYVLGAGGRGLAESDIYKFLDSFEIVGAQQAPNGKVDPGPGPAPGPGPGPGPGKQPGDGRPPADPVRPQPEDRGAAPWTPRLPVLDFPPPAANSGKFPGLLAYWPLDEDGRPSRAEQSGLGGPSARVVGGWWIPGVRGKALLLDGKGDYLSFGDTPSLNFGDKAALTVCLWVASKDGNGLILSMRNHTDGGPVVALNLQNGNVMATVRSDGPEVGEARATGPALKNEQWHHLALVRTSQGDWKLYVDGRMTNQLLGGRTGGPVTTTLRTVGCDRYHVVRGTGAPSYLSGAVDEVAFFSRALADVEIRELAGRK